MWLSGRTNWYLQFFLISVLNAADASLSNKRIVGLTLPDAMSWAHKITYALMIELSVLFFIGSASM